MIRILPLLLLCATLPAAASPPALLLAPRAAAPSPAAVLVPHHASYALALVRAPGGTVVGVDGTMDYQLSDACEAWATAQRLSMAVTDNDGTVSRLVSDYATWEQKDGHLLRFRLRQTSDQKIIAQVEGEATRRADGSGQIHYRLPEDKIVALPAGTLFPLAQTLALLNGASQRHKFLAAPLFDGTDENGAEDSFTVIGNFAPKVGALPPPQRWPLLQRVASGRVAISFFDHDPKTDDQPSYQVAMRYWQNGVSDDVAMDFGDFVVRASLVDLTSNGKRC